MKTPEQLRADYRRWRRDQEWERVALVRREMERERVALVRRKMERRISDSEASALRALDEVQVKRAGPHTEFDLMNIFAFAVLAGIVIAVLAFVWRCLTA